MDLIKKLFPLSFKLNGNPKKLAIGALIYIGLQIIFGYFIAPIFLSALMIMCFTIILLPVALLLFPVLDVITIAVSTYVIAGIVISILTYAGVLKNDAKAPAEEAQTVSVEN